MFGNEASNESPSAHLREVFLCCPHLFSSKINRSNNQDIMIEMKISHLKFPGKHDSNFLMLKDASLKRILSDKTLIYGHRLQQNLQIPFKSERKQTDTRLLTSC
jgi:hypothetical protein